MFEVQFPARRDADGAGPELLEREPEALHVWPLSPVRGRCRFAWLAVERVVRRRKRQRLVESEQFDRLVGRSRGRKESQLESLALRALVQRHEQVQTGGVEEGQAAQIEHHAPGILDVVQGGAQRLDRGKVELAAGLHDRDVIASCTSTANGSRSRRATSAGQAAAV